MKSTIITLLEEDLNVPGVITIEQYGPICLGPTDFKVSSMSLNDYLHAEVVRYIHMYKGRIIGCYILKDRYLDHNIPQYFTVQPQEPNK